MHFEQALVSAHPWPSLRHKSSVLSSLRDPDDLFFDLDPEDIIYLSSELTSRIQRLHECDQVTDQMLASIANAIDVATLACIVLESQGHWQAEVLSKQLAKDRCVLMCAICERWMSDGMGSMELLVGQISFYNSNFPVKK